MKIGHGIAILLAAFLLIGTACAAQTVWEDIQTLNDSGSPGMKMAAARRLGDLGKVEKWPEVVAALARQAQSSDAPVRESARDALTKLLGPENASKLLPLRRPAEPFGPDGLNLEVDALASRALSKVRPAIKDPFFDPLLDPHASLSEAYPAFRAIEGGGLDSKAMQALLAAARSAPSDRQGAEWALWCLVGPDESRWMIDLGAAPPADSFVTYAKTRWIDNIESGEAIPFASRLVRSSWPELRQLGEAALRRTIALTAAKPGAENNAALQAAKLALQPVILERQQASIRDFRAAIERGWIEPELIRAALANYDSENADLRGIARRYWEMLVDVKSDKLDRRAAVTLLEMARNDPKPTEKLRIFERLDRMDSVSRLAITKKLAVLLSEGEPRLDAMITHWKMDDAPEIQLARKLKEAKESDLFQWARPLVSLREWFTRAMEDEDAGATKLAALLVSDDGDTSKYAARWAMLAPDRFAVVTAVSFAVKNGKVPTPAALLELKPRAAAIGIALQPLLKAGADSNRAALTTLAAIGATEATIATDLEKLLHSQDREERYLAAQGLGTDQALRLARGPDILKDLRNPDPRIRSSASHEARRLAIDAPEIMSALVRAVDTGDMPAREGLTLALERAWAKQQPAAEVLATADAEPDPTIKVYLRAARRAVGR